jgi:hypothetical protein
VLVNPLERLHQRLIPLKTALLNHPIYGEIDCLESLRVFMEHHIFAVWDFMSLLKTLQRLLTCVEVPWLPGVDALGCRFINEIVVAEESDSDGRDGFVSHFELYRRAMSQCGANTAPIDAFLDKLRLGKSVPAALETVSVGACARHFVLQTFDTIQQGNLCALASAFTFGREDLLPALFQRIVEELNVETRGGLELFRYYLNRHIGLDGEEHGPMASRLMQSICGSDEILWTAAEHAAASALVARQQLWDGIYEILRGMKQLGQLPSKRA